MENDPTPDNCNVPSADGNVHDTKSNKAASAQIAAFLTARSPEFCQLLELRVRGWKNPKGDVHFQQQRSNADNASQHMAETFYKLMKRIAREMHEDTGVFRAPKPVSNPVRILDLCVAPGGYLETVMEYNRGAQALAFTLPVSDGGHQMLIKSNPDVKIELLDITMLGEDMGVGDIPDHHPDHDKFLSRRFDPDMKFDIVFCDGQVLRTQHRASYRENRETRRLSCTQLALSLQHIKPGGTMIVLLHKVEAYSTIKLLRTFRQFSNVKLFKPTVGHGTRSSFYMIAKQVKSQSSEASEAVARWKGLWKTATFGTDEEYKAAIDDSKESVGDMLDEFGTELVTLGTKVWKTQGEFLKKAHFTRG